MALDSIDSIIGQSAFDQVAAMDKALKSLSTTMSDTADKAKSMQLSPKDNNITDLVKQVESLKEANAKLKASVNEYTNAKKAAADADRAAKAAALEQAKAIQAENRAILDAHKNQ